MRRTPQPVLKCEGRARRRAPRPRATRPVVTAALAAVLLLLGLGLPGLVPVREAEAQNAGGGAMELIPAGSLVIAMDNTRQNIGAAFNLKAYGVAVRLLHAGVPVKWAIQPGKAKDGTDFTVTAQRIYPSAIGAASQSFSGGPFVVHRDYAVPAKAVISAYATTNNVAVYETTADVTAPIRHTLTHKPKVAVFDDGGSAAIHTAYLVAAGFTSGTHYDVIPAATLVTVNADACFTIGTEPHWDGAGGTDPQVNAIRLFVQSGGNFLAECEGISAYENNATYGRFQTTTGLVDGAGSTPFQYPSPDLPYSQFVGEMANAGGSIRDYAPAAGGAYRASTEIHARKSTGGLRGSDGSLAVRASVSRLAGTTTGGFVFYLGGHEYTTGDITNINGIRLYMNAVMTPSGRPSNCNLTVVPRTIAGTIYEDVNGDSQLGDAVGRPGVDVRLYQDGNNNGLVDAADTYLAGSVTDAAGQYSFQVAPQATGNNYLVAVDSKDVSPSAGLIGGRGDAWAEQTYGDDPTTAAFALGARFGGRQSGVSDSFNQASTTPANNTYEHLARVDVSSADVTNAHFAFSFNVVTNTRAGDNSDDDALSATRTVQGSLRQFIQNANAVVGANYMRFVPAVAENAGSYWRVTVTAALAAVVDASTTFDGRAYDSSNGTSVRDTNAGSLGAGGTVGVQALALPQVQRPELEIFDNAGIAVGLDLQAANCAVRRLAIYGFGTLANNDAHAQVRVGNVAGALIEENVIGSAATGFADPGAATRSVGDNVRVVGGDGGTLRNNLVGFTQGKGIQLGGGANGWLVEGNEVRGNGINNSNLDGIEVEGGSNTATIRGNLFAGNEACGIDTYQSSGSNTVENNTVTGNGVGPNANIESPGVRLYGTGSLVRLNVIAANFGAGVMVNSASSANTISRNSVYANGTITNKAGAAASNQIGIDLLSAADSQTTGTAPFVTRNDSGDADAGANGLLNFPVLTLARLSNGNLVLQGYASPGAAIEFFVAAPDPSGFGEGQTYLLTLTEGSAADTDATTGTYTSPVNGLNVGTDTTNLFTFTVPLPPGVAVGTVLTATATVSGSTSEFSGNVTVSLAPPEVRLVKACTAPADCLRVEGQPPGTDLTYSIDFTNVGGSPAQVFVIKDPIPASTDFKVGSATTNLGTTGMTVTVEYSEDNGANYNYTPASGAGGAPAGYDRKVTHVRWTFAGALPSASPNNAGSVGLTVRIR
ncbi:MAG TPA: right-handed parallel beta-helix repeat-containing protein [Pyrinomonadaceae bacterium]|nr:right-handed parallel beta-helix repeat-containing protein [Pyrinomonadaceae bacterium]